MILKKLESWYVQFCCQSKSILTSALFFLFYMKIHEQFNEWNGTRILLHLFLLLEQILCLSKFNFQFNSNFKFKKFKCCATEINICICIQSYLQNTYEINQNAGASTFPCRLVLTSSLIFLKISNKNSERIQMLWNWKFLLYVYALPSREQI